MKVMIGTTVHTDNAPRWRVEIIPDSAILRDGKPLFVPITDAVPEFSAGIAFRASRLGKNIARKFASRYFDAMALCVKMNHTADEALFAAEDLRQFADNAVTLGEWVDLSTTNPASADVKVRERRFNAEASYTAALDLLSDASRHATIKMGDVVAVDLQRLEPQPQINDFVTGTINGNTALRFRIK